jgi:hypothetical protein
MLTFFDPLAWSTLPTHTCPRAHGIQTLRQDFNYGNMSEKNEQAPPFHQKSYPILLTCTNCEISSNTSL